MGILNRISDKIAGRPSSSRPSSETVHLLSTLALADANGPATQHASLPYGFEWSPVPLDPEMTWMLSMNTIAQIDEYKKTAGLTLLQRMWEKRKLGHIDFNIRCGEWQWGVHKEVLAASSKYFEETFAASQHKGTYLTMIELQRCDTANAGRPDCYNPKYVEEFIHFLYNFTITQGVREMPEYERLCTLAKVHRTATQFRAPDVINALTSIIDDCLPKFNENDGLRQQISGPTLVDFARVCRWVFGQPEFPGLVWKLQLHLVSYLKENVTSLVQSREMCEMLRECIFKELDKEDLKQQSASK
ncbi:hypothetical protein E4T47_00950 [Aureobasidium subglaciale]|nr:hypothetical protein E4T47_00950 [Aureobasidium subglaciale]